MIEVVGVRYHDVGQIYFYTPKKQTYTINVLPRWLQKAEK